MSAKEAVDTQQSPDDGYFPAPSEYDPHLSVAQWREILRDPELTTPDTLAMLTTMLRLGGEATCAELARHGDKSAWHYNALGMNLGRRICAKCHVPAYKTGDRTIYYIVPFRGRWLDGHTHYVWRLRDELREALAGLESDPASPHISATRTPGMKKNCILYGPPGTGKTWHTHLYAVAIIEERPLEELKAEDPAAVRERFAAYRQQGLIEFTTFHQSYSYEDFIEGIRPVIEDDGTETEGKLAYRVEDGIFKRFCQQAETETFAEALREDLSVFAGLAVNPSPVRRQNRVFIIDEINRGNIAGIFGELITLIEPTKRLGAAEALKVRLPYSRTEFGVPDNVYILGTMNTADRSLTALDIALRRRFAFERVAPEPELLASMLLGDSGYTVADLLRTMNRRIAVLIDQEHCIGHAPFMKLPQGEVAVDALADIFRHAILPLLEEYFFEDWQKIRLVFNDQQKPDAAHQFVVAADDDEDLFGPEFAPSEPGWKMNPAALARMTSYVRIVDAAATCTEAAEADTSASQAEGTEADDAAPREQKSSRTFTPPESLAEAMRCNVSQVKEYNNNVFIRFSLGKYAIYDKESATKLTNQIQFCRSLVASDPLFRNVTLPEDYNTYQSISAIMAVLHDRRP